MSPPTPGLEALIAAQNRVPPNRAATAGVYVYSQDDRTTPFIKKVMGRGDPAGNRYFSRLSDAIMEALDVPPQVLVLDLHMTDDLLHAHLERVRTAAECHDTAILIRTRALAETDVLSFISLEVNHIALTFSPISPVLKEIDQLLATPKRRTRISNVVAVLGTRIGSRLTAEAETTLPDSLLNKFQRHYGFTLRTHDAPRLRGCATWGFIPVTNDVVAIFNVHVAANALNARRHAKRASALLMAHGFDAASPAGAVDYLRDHLAPYLLPGEHFQASYLTYDRTCGHGRFAGPHGALRVTADGRHTIVPPTGAAISATVMADTGDVPLNLDAGGGLILPVQAPAAGLPAGEGLPLSPGLPVALRRDTAWLAVECARSPHDNVTRDMTRATA